jgi:hypothetical protein
MKKLIATTLATVASLAAFGQGTVNFANLNGSAVNAPVTLSDGTTKLAGAQYMAALLAGPSAGSLAQIATTPFVSAGYFLGGTQVIPTVAGGSTALVAIEVWNTSAGASFAAAQASGQPNAWAYMAGATTTTPLSVKLGDPNATPPGTPAALVGLGATKLNGGGVVPEPSTFALAGLGAAALMIFRRRK